MFNLMSLKKLFLQVIARVMSIPSLLRNNVGFNRNTLLFALLAVILYVAYRHHFISRLTGDITSGVSTGVDMVLDTVGLEHGTSQSELAEPEGYEPGAFMSVN